MMEKIKENLYLRTLEESLKNISSIVFGEDYIEVPGICIFSTKKSFLYQFLNPGIDIIEISNKDFEKIISILKIEEKDILFFDRKTKPSGKVRLNLVALKRNLVLARKEKETLIINNIVFTSDILEFEGSGMFTGKKEVYFVEKDILIKIENFLF